MLNDELVEAIAALDEARSMEIVQALVAGGATSEEILPLISQGVAQVGDKFAGGEFFIGDLIVSGMLIRSIITRLPAKTASAGRSCRGRIVIGVAEGDIHDIGKDIVIEMLRVEGFEVIDLGVDVKASRFLYAAETYKPDILLISGMMNFTLECMRKITGELRQRGLRDKLAVVVGGGVVTPNTAGLVDADAAFSNPMDTMRYCINVVQGGRCDWTKRRE